MENSNRYSSQRARGREHIPLYLKGFIALRVVQLVLALTTTGLCAFGIHVAPISGACLMIFVFSSPKAYNYWAVLALDIFLLFCWLCSFALLAAQVAYLFDSYYYYGDYYSSDIAVIFDACMAAAAGIGGLQFALFVTSLVIHSVMLHRHRKAGLHCNPVNPLATPVGGSQVMHGKEGAEVTANPVFQHAPNQAQAQAAPPYGHQDANYMNQMVPRQQQLQQQHVAVPQPTFTPPPVQHRQQSHYRQPSPTPLSAMPSGGSFAQNQSELSAVPPMPKVHEAPGNVYHAQ
ncbi:hypothetical protein LZ30DRAFT_786485 [Colletotrichum cereale]|nr:hypothetical protein LZ30DRAFT_786485 [Colletotrichum cereale]